MSKTLLITNDFPPVVSGISTVFYQVWKRMDPEKHWILTPNVEGGKEFDSGKNLKVIRHPALRGKSSFSKIINSLIQFGYAKALVMFSGIKIIHAGQIWISGTIAFLLKVFFKRKYFLWVYGGETTPVYMKNALTTYWAKKLLNNADKIVTNSKFCQKEFLDYGFPEEHCPIILPGVDVSVFTPGEAPKELIQKWNPDGKKILLTVARVSERKGHDLVIRSLPKILESFPDVLYLIVGKGPDTERLRKLADDLGISDSVKFCGFVPDEDLPDYYRMSDIYVMPNREIFDTTDSIEGFGISFVEASSCGKPVIGGKSGGAVEAVADGVSGYLVDPESVDEFTSAVLRLLSDQNLLKKIGDDGRKRAVEEMDWSSRADKLVKLVDK